MLSISSPKLVYNQQTKNNNIKSSSQNAINPNVAFKRVTPKHFFINIEDYDKNIKWGKFVAGLANNNKKNVLSNGSTVRKNISLIGEKYNGFVTWNMSNSYPEYFGILKRQSDKDFRCDINILSRYWRFAERIYNNFSNNKNNLLNREISGKNYKMYQAQNQVDGKNVVLTQFNAELEKGSFFFIHPPYGTADILIDKSEKTLKELKQYKDKKLNKQEINNAYKKIGSIHWCLAQGMPFLRGSASIADIYTKSLFESLKIQTTPWKKGLAPDWEAFLTPHDEYCEKYRSFFEPPKPSLKQKVIGMFSGIGKKCKTFSEPNTK